MSSVGFVPLQAQSGGADFSFFLMMGAIFLIFYMLVIRPQQKQQKEREAFLATAAKGDEVVTQGGIHGKVMAVDGETLEVEVARVRGEKVKLRIALGRVDQLTKAGQAGAGGGSDSDDKTSKNAK
ncbi:MAG: preprotein translocase subunit YajC [bacterium]|nr:preprotein translocase subunit YajC [Deltaproteobacteria bacterium]MCP4906076.1 preprotein translocase subunit YajC [bacterium]